MLWLCLWQVGVCLLAGSIGYLIAKLKYQE